MKLSRSLWITLFSLLLPSGLSFAADAEKLVVVPEMEKPAGIVYDPARRREQLRARSDSSEALDALRAKVADAWPDVVAVDWVQWSRYQVEATRGWKAPTAPGPLEGQIIGRDEATGRLSLELRGPRLPTKYEIVHRYLYFFSTFDPATKQLGPLVVTIRGWVLE